MTPIMDILSLVETTRLPAHLHSGFVLSRCGVPLLLHGDPRRTGSPSLQGWPAPPSWSRHPCLEPPGPLPPWAQTLRAVLAAPIPWILHAGPGGRPCWCLSRGS